MRKRPFIIPAALIALGVLGASLVWPVVGVVAVGISVVVFAFLGVAHAYDTPRRTYRSKHLAPPKSPHDGPDLPLAA